MANIKTHLNNIKGALYGKDVRGSIHDGIDAINKEVENTTGRQVDLENTFDQLVINAGNSNAEIVDARVGQDGKSYSKLGDRLDDFSSQLAQNTNKQSKSVTDFIEYKNEKDDWEMLQNCLNSIKQVSSRNSGYVSTGWSEKLIFPTGDYKISKPLVCDLHYPNIDFQGCRITPTSDFEGEFAIEFTNIWNGKFSNLVLDGFDKHIKIYNNNLDSGNIKIDDVSMYGGSVGYDIECRSSKTTITNFKFNNVKQPAIIRHADKITFRSGWMDAGVLTEEYQGMFEIDNYAQVIIEDMIYVPRPQSVNKIYKWRNKVR